MKAALLNFPTEYHERYYFAKITSMNNKDTNTIIINETGKRRQIKLADENTPPTHSELGIKSFSTSTCWLVWSDKQ